MEENKQKKPAKLGFKNIFGTTSMACTDSLASALVTSYFMLYLTDYAGLGSWAATLGSILLVIARVFDAVNDPLEGWIMDRAKPGKNGKYRPFIMLAIVLMTVGVGSLFFIPDGASPVLASVWVIVAYLLYDIGYSFFAPELMYRSITLDAGQRATLTIGPRLNNMLWGIICSALISTVNAVNALVNNYHTAFGLTVLSLVLIAGALSMAGILMLKEKYIAEKDENEPAVKITDIFKMFRENKPFKIKILAVLFSGFIYTLMFATNIYYGKWAYCADLTTGAVDTAKFGTINLIFSMLSFTPLILGTVIAKPAMKWFKTPDRAARILTLGQAIPQGLIFLFQLLGILRLSPVFLIAPMAVSMLAMCMQFMPTSVLNMETMDYDAWKNNVDRSALNNATGRLIGKAQSALATAAIGALLTAVGYVVDSKTDTYLGELSRIPALLNWFTVIMGLIPFVLGIIAYFIMRKYPVTNEMRKEMAEDLQKKEG